MDDTPPDTSAAERQLKLITELAEERQRIETDFESEIANAARNHPELTYTEIGVAAGFPLSKAQRRVALIATRAGVPLRRGGARRGDIYLKTPRGTS